MRYCGKIFIGLTAAVTLSLSVQARELKTSAPPLQVLGARVGHPEDGITISQVFLRRTFKNRPGVRLKIVHPGYCNRGADGKPTLLKNRDQSVNALNFATGAHMSSAVVVFCENSSTRVISDFDARVLAACAANKLRVAKGYVSVADVQERTLAVSLLDYGLKHGKMVYFRILPGGRLQFVSYST